MRQPQYRIKLNTTNLCHNEMLSAIDMNNIKSKEEEKAMLLLHRICDAHIFKQAIRNRIDNIELNDEDRELIVKYGWNQSENIEVRARCNEVLSRDATDKRSFKIAASESYLEAFKQYDKIGFIYRSISIRDFRAINTEVFLTDIISVITNGFNYPFWIKEIIELLKRSYPIEKLKPLSSYLESEKIKFKNTNKFREEREYIEAQFAIKTISGNQYHKELGLSHESEADMEVKNKKPNTIYPNIEGKYQKAYNEIYIIREKETPILERIKRKLLEEKKILMEATQKYGIKSKQSIPSSFKESIDNFIDSIEITTFENTIALMLSIPFAGGEEIKSYKNIVRKASFAASAFGHSKLDERGLTVGSEDPEISLHTEAHNYFRFKRMYAIDSYIRCHINNKVVTDGEELYNMLEELKPEFIEKSNLIFWTKGFLAGLNDDFITAAYILTPQLERALHNIAEIAKGNLATLEKKRQLSPTLGPILSNLKGVFDEEILFEIDSFLQGEIDINFRNNLLHGLLNPFEVLTHGVYLWWLCLKIYFMGLVEIE